MLVDRRSFLHSIKSLLVTTAAFALIRPSVARGAALIAAPPQNSLNDASDQNSNRVNVLDFGAKGDGIVDDTASIQAAIHHAEGRNDGATVFLPKGTYLISSGRRVSPVNQKKATDGVALVIRGSNIHIQGEGAGLTIIIHRGYGGSNFNDTWQTVAGQVWRGHGFMVVSGALGTRFSDFEMTAQAKMTGNNHFPASPSDGDGWDITNKCVYLQADGTFDRTSFDRVHFHNYRGEIVYGAGSSVGTVSCRNSVMNDTNGDCWSVQAACTIEKNHFFNAAGNCIDGAQGGFDGKPTVIENNILENAGVAGVYSSILHSYGRLGSLSIIQNTIKNAKVSGIPITSAQDTVVYNNDLLDCGWGKGSHYAIQISTNDLAPIYKLSIMGNRIRYQNYSPSGPGIIVFDGKKAGIIGLTVKNNSIAGLSINKSQIDNDPRYFRTPNFGKENNNIVVSNVVTS